MWGLHGSQAGEEVVLSDDEDLIVGGYPQEGRIGLWRRDAGDWSRRWRAMHSSARDFSKSNEACRVVATAAAVERSAPVEPDGGGSSGGSRKSTERGKDGPCSRFRGPKKLVD